jgi:hypothetical protein
MELSQISDFDFNIGHWLDQPYLWAGHSDDWKLCERYYITDDIPEFKKKVREYHSNEGKCRKSLEKLFRFVHPKNTDISMYEQGLIRRFGVPISDVTWLIPDANTYKFGKLDLFDYPEEIVYNDIIPRPLEDNPQHITFPAMSPERYAVTMLQQIALLQSEFPDIIFPLYSKIRPDNTIDQAFGNFGITNFISKEGRVEVEQMFNRCVESKRMMCTFMFNFKKDNDITSLDSSTIITYLPSDDLFFIFGEPPTSERDQKKYFIMLDLYTGGNYEIYALPKADSLGSKIQNIGASKSDWGWLAGFYNIFLTRIILNNIILGNKDNIGLAIYANLAFTINKWKNISYALGNFYLFDIYLNATLLSVLNEETREALAPLVVDGKVIPLKGLFTQDFDVLRKQEELYNMIKRAQVSIWTSKTNPQHSFWKNEDVKGVLDSFKDVFYAATTMILLKGSFETDSTYTIFSPEIDDLLQNQTAVNIGDIATLGQYIFWYRAFTVKNNGSVKAMLKSLFLTSQAISIMTIAGIAASIIYVPA